MQYRPELDGLRAIAVLMVVAFHSNGPTSGGFVGVDVFFVLSAYLITSILAAEKHQTGRLDLRRFYWRRFLRLMPALLLLLLVYAAAAPFVWPDHDHARDIALTGLYLSDYSYALARLPYYLRHTWSLSVEEHFYLVWPFLLVALFRCKAPTRVLIAAYVVASIWRYSFDDWLSYYYRFDTRATGFILGAALALSAPKISRPAFYCALSTLALTALTANIAHSKFILTAAELAAAGLLLGALQGYAPLLAHPTLVRIGKLSYGIYLWHYPVAFELRDKLGFLPTVTLTLLFAMIMASISYVTVEAVGRRLKNGRLLPATSIRSSAGRTADQLL